MHETHTHNRYVCACVCLRQGVYDWRPCLCAFASKLANRILWLVFRSSFRSRLIICSFNFQLLLERNALIRFALSGMYKLLPFPFVCQRSYPGLPSLVHSLPFAPSAISHSVCATIDALIIAIIVCVDDPLWHPSFKYSLLSIHSPSLPSPASSCHPFHCPYWTSCWSFGIWPAIWHFDCMFIAVLLALLVIPHAPSSSACCCCFFFFFCCCFLCFLPL